VDLTIGLRVAEADEYDGLDLSQHGESGYNMEDAMSLTFAENGGGEASHGSGHRPKPVGAHG
jgi:hypothetical protein